MPNYHLNKPWGKVEDATDHPNVFATMSGSSGNYTSDLSGAQIYALLQENPKQVIFLKDTDGRACPLTTPPTSGSSSLKFSILIGTTLYEYTIASGGNGVSVSTTNVSASSSASEVFTFHITGSGSSWSMDTTWSAISTAKSAGKLIVANPGSDYVYYSCGDPTDDGITLSCVYFTPSGAKMRSFTIDTDGVVTYNGVASFSADNVVKYTAQSLSSEQQAQACSNIGATNKFTVQFSMVNGNLVCNRTYSAIATAVANNAVIEAVYGAYSGFMCSFNANGAVFVTTGLPLIAVVYTLVVDNTDAIIFNEYSLASITDDIKTALLDIAAHVAWDDTNGQSRYDALHDALYPARLASIEADYAQDRTIWDNDSLDVLKEGDDLIVTALYDDGTSRVLEASEYTLSGTLTAGTSTITVTYEGKTDTFNVTVTAWNPYLFSLENGQIVKVTGSTSGNPTGHEHELEYNNGLNSTRRRSYPTLRVGVQPYRDVNDNWSDTPYYPIPVPADAIKAKISITPATQYHGESMYTYADGVGYTRQADPGWKQGSFTHTFTAGAYDYITVVSKYDSSGTSYPTEPTALVVEFLTE